MKEQNKNKHWDVVNFHFLTINEKNLIRDDLKYLRCNLSFNQELLNSFYDIDFSEGKELKTQEEILHDFIDKIDQVNHNEYQSTRYLVGLVNKFITSIILFNTKFTENQGTIIILPSKELIFDLSNLNFTNYVYFIFELLNQCNNTVFSRPFILALPVRFKNLNCSFIYYKNTSDGRIEK